MNIQEAIKKVEYMGEYEHFVDEPISKKSVLNVISQIDEPKKIKIPQFVADWLEYMKEKKYSLRGALERASERAEVYEWMYPENELVFVRAWLDGYEVEQEQLYTVEIPNNRRMFRAVLCSTSNKIVMVEIKKELEHKNNACYRLTEAEIKKDFKWAWDAGFAEPVEVQEVE